LRDPARPSPPRPSNTPAAAALALLLLAQAGAAHAGLSFVQVLQAQTDLGEDGVFGKSWVELSGRRMRIVSGYARRVQKDGSTEDPQRLVQIIDLVKKERLLLWPETRSYARAPLAEVAYADGLERRLESGTRDRRLELLNLGFDKRPGLRTFLGADCSHYRLRAELSLRTAEGSTVPARMDLDAWVAPVSGHLSRNLLDLIAFENEYRAAAGGSLTPLDHERFQVREAAAYLGVSAPELRAIVERIRERLRELPSYPVAVSVAWWRGDLPPVPGSAPTAPEGSAATTRAGDLRALKPLPAAPKPEPRRLTASKAGRPARRTVPWRRKGPLFSRSRPAFKSIDWHRSERRINEMYEKERSKYGDFPFGGLDEPRVSSPPRRRTQVVYPVFREDYLKTLESLLEAMTQEAPPEPPAQEPSDAAEGTPFYQIYAELHGLEKSSDVPERDLVLPADYVERPSAGAQ
jgi:hypothetical protein